MVPFLGRSRADWIRTSDHLNPIKKQAFLAQFGKGTAHPGITWTHERKWLVYNVLYVYSMRHRSASCGIKNLCWGYHRLPQFPGERKGEVLRRAISKS
jgi:hypothetical protein